MKKLALLLVAVASLSMACKKEEAVAPATAPTEAKPAEPAAKPAEPAPTEAKPAEPAAADPAAAPAAAGETGVKECDDYIAKFETCVGKMPAEAQAAAKTGLDSMKSGWKQAAAASPEAKTALATGCTQALEAAKTAYASMGCAF